jgi:HK97 family phage major capsid protein
MTQATMFALEGWLAQLGPAAFLISNDATPTLEDIQDELLNLNEEAEAIQARADGESRPLTSDEDEDIKRIFAEFKDKKAELERRKQIADQAAELAIGVGRKTEPDPLPGQDPDDENGASGAPQAAAKPRPARVEPRPKNQRESGRWGWPSMGAYATAVKTASMHAGYIDPRLAQNAATTFGQEGVGEDGGFAVPPEFREAIMVKVLGEDSLIGRTDQLTSGSNTFTIPVDETTPWQGTGGILAFWENEGVAITQSKPALDTVSVRLNKLTALVPVTSELLEDASGLDSYLRKKAPEKLDYKVTEAIVDGSGAGQPLGILQSASLVSVAKETSQTADTVNHANINKMWARMSARWRQNAVWLINQDVESQLLGLNSIADGSGTPMFVPPGGINTAPFGTIYGRPIVPTEACKEVGTKGDIFLVDLNQYMTVRKTSGIRAETSVHLWFDQDMTAFRFILRVAGQPWWKTAITRANGTNTLSWAVSLDDRA